MLVILSTSFKSLDLSPGAAWTKSLSAESDWSMGPVAAWSAHALQLPSFSAITESTRVLGGDLHSGWSALRSPFSPWNRDWVKARVGPKQRGTRGKGFGEYLVVDRLDGSGGGV